ncbi:L10-interacting MYB domain-containing protein-like [Curcuma longa]|uniref:L10-interacting MYB domain-containing protein-like n=1 Tax=Curcuma longa TaxID=136217 RepID=UPI003D9EE7BF
MAVDSDNPSISTAPVRDRNRPGANLNIVSYTLARQEFNKLSGLCYSTKQIRTKWENMRKEWILWKKLLLDTGTGWSYEGGTIKATEEWWKRKKAENKEYGKFKHRGPLLPEEQEELFGKSLATGGFAVTSAEIPQEAVEKLSQPLHWSEEADNLEEYQGSLVQLLELGNHTAPSPETTLVKTPPVSSADKKKRKKNHQELSKSIANLNGTVSSYMAHTASSSRGDIYSIQACIEEMDRIPKVNSSPTLYVNGLFLFRDPLYREMFILTKQVDKKVEFLRRGGEK